MTGTRRLVAVSAAAMLALVACGGSSGGGETKGTTGDGNEAAGQAFTPPDLKPLDKLGTPEGELNIVAWAGYAEDGSTDPSVDWVTPFEKETGCQVSVKTAPTSDDMVNLMKTGQYDVVSASGDASLRLIASGDVEPVNTDLVPNYADVFEGLKLKPWNSVDGVAYGIPHGRGANLLMYNTDVVSPAPTSWGAVFDGADYAGKVTAYDSPIYIADAALYLMKTKPDLGIKNPYALDDKQFAAAVDLLKAQNANVGEYWSDYLKAEQAFNAGDTVIGTTWQIIANYVTADKKVKVKAILPSEGATGWSDTWMVATKSQHKTCAYLWMDHIISPKVNAEVAEWFGEAPANSKSCAETVDKSFCDTFHADDEAYFDQVWYWNTPITQCLDGRTDVQCKDYGDWTTAWQEIKG